MKYIAWSVLAVCLLAGQASADYYMLNTDQALAMDHISHVPAVSSTFVGVYTDPWEYDPRNAEMYYSVGYVGTMLTMRDFKGGPSSAVGWSEMLLGDSAVSLNLSGATGYRLTLSNDNDDYWYARLYLKTSSGDEYWSDWTGIGSDTQKTLTWDFTDAMTGLADVTTIGFAVGGYLIGTGGNPSNADAFHMSALAVPIPAAVLLGMLGLTAAGLKLRKYV